MPPAEATRTTTAANALKLLARRPSLSFPPRSRIASLVPSTRPAIAPAGANRASASTPDVMGSALLPKPPSSSASSVATKPATAPLTPPKTGSAFFMRLSIAQAMHAHHGARYRQRRRHQLEPPPAPRYAEPAIPRGRSHEANPNRRHHHRRGDRARRPVAAAAGFLSGL